MVFFGQQGSPSTEGDDDGGEIWCHKKIGEISDLKTIMLTSAAIWLHFNRENIVASNWTVQWVK